MFVSQAPLASSVSGGMEDAQQLSGRVSYFNPCPDPLRLMIFEFIVQSHLIMRKVFQLGYNLL